MTMMFAYRATERGILLRSSARIKEERVLRLTAQRAAWEAEQRERAALQRRKEEAEAQRVKIQTELRLAGLPYSKSYHDIEAKALKVFNLSRSELRSNRRSQDVVIAKQFVAYWAVRLTGFSLPMIGRLMGGRDHTTVLHGKRAYPEKRAKMGRYLRPAK